MGRWELSEENPTPEKSEPLTEPHHQFGLAINWVGYPNKPKLTKMSEFYYCSKMSKCSKLAKWSKISQFSAISEHVAKFQLVNILKSNGWGGLGRRLPV